MSLYNLSDELLLEIAEWVNTSGYIPDYSRFTERGSKFLASLAVCSRRLNSIATPVLYRTFVQTKYKALPSFLRTLSEKPEMRALVKTIVVYEISEEESMDMGGFSQQDLKRVGLEVDVLDYFETENPDWMENLEAGKWQAVAALLLLLLPSLEEIEIGSYRGPNFVENKYIDTALAYATRQQFKPDAPHSLQNLKTVSMAYCDTEYGMSIAAILPFCALPSVTTARIHMASDEQIVPNLQRYHTQDLQINNSNIAPSVLLSILRCFSSLKKLFYENGGPTVGYEDFLAQYLGQGIAHLKGSLEQLTVLDQGAGDFGTEDEELGTIGSLAGFKKLRKLAIFYNCLLAESSADDDDEDDGNAAEEPRLVNVLPFSLEFLAVAQCEPGVLGQVRELLETRQQGGGQSFLSLQKVIIGFVSEPFAIAGSKGKAEMRRIEEELVADGKEMGVEVVIVHPKFRIGGSTTDFDDAFHFDGVLSP
jgi:hypothetical protein